MANPFKDAEKKKKVPPGSGMVAPVQAEVEPKIEEKPVEPVAKENPLAGMIETKKAGKTQAYYLSLESIDKIEKLAKINKCSASKALDMLIKNVL